MNQSYLKDAYLSKEIEHSFAFYLDRLFGNFIKSVQVLKYIVPVIGLVLLFSSCEKEVSDPTIDFKVVTNVDSVYANELVTFDFSGSSADNITIYTGDSGHEYSKYPTDKGSPLTAPYGKYYYTYSQSGEFTVTVIAVNSGSEGTIFKEIYKTLSINVKNR
jgi:hypothetical protein